MMMEEFSTLVSTAVYHGLRGNVMVNLRVGYKLIHASLDTFSKWMDKVSCSFIFLIVSM